ncbi:MAG: sensor histidine kinase [Bryobacteraceae bacterium]
MPKTKVLLAEDHTVVTKGLQSLLKLQAWWLPASFACEERAHAGRTLFLLSLGLMATGAFSLVQAWVYHWIGAAWTEAIEELCLIAALWLNRRGEVERATQVICFSELACGLVLISLFGVGFSDEGLLLFPLILVTAAVLLDWRPYMVFASLVVVSVASTGFILAATGSKGTSYNRVTNVINILLITVVAVGLLARNLKKSVFQSQEAERRIKALSGRLMNAQEEERARLARELHDDLSQQIAALSIAMGNLKQHIPQEQADARAQGDRIHQKLVLVSETVRRISHELHPAILQYSGLPAALKSYCHEFEALTGMRVPLTIEGEFEGVPSGAALCIYRITQEALRNVAKHAKVATAAVELRHSDGVLSLIVSDTGVGIEPGRAEAADGLGLVSIQERTRLVGGTVEIKSKPNQGTTITVRISG